MKWTATACTALIVGCANSPPPDNPSAPGAGRPHVDERREARALEQAEANCESQGKRAVARREEGETFYDCVDK
jgi:putative hemolysin